MKVHTNHAKHSTKQTKQVHRLPTCFAVVAASPAIFNIDIETQVSCRAA